MHPGKLLREDFLEPMGLSPTQLAHDIGMPRGVVLEIVRGRAPIDANLALRLACYFRTTPQFWVQLQASYDLDRVARKDGARIRREVRPWRKTA